MTEAVGRDVLERRLSWVRRGSAYFARKLAELPDAEFDAATTLDGWTRRHLVAHVGYNARAIARLVDWAATGVENPMYPSPQARAAEIDDGAGLSTQALRALAEHAAIDLDVRWRDLPDERWSAEVRTARGRIVPAAETPWMRAREVWIHAADLGNGGSFVDFPPDFVDALLADVTGLWQREQHGPSLSLRPTDRDARLHVEVGSEPPAIVRGRAADLARWVTGRGASDLTPEAGRALPALGRWL